MTGTLEPGDDRGQQFVQRLRSGGWRRGRTCRGARRPTGPAPRSTSTPRSTAGSRLAPDVTVPTVVMPASRSRMHSVCARQAERERRHLRPQVEQHLDLGRPGIVVEAGLAELGAVPCASGASAAAYVSIASAVAALGCGTNRLAPSGPVSGLRAAAMPLREHLGASVAGRDETQAACIGPGGSQLRRRRTAGHRRDDHRNRRPRRSNRSASSPPIVSTAHSYHADARDVVGVAT